MKGSSLDVGSGVGRPVFAAATLHPFARVVGMECLHGLHALGTELAQLYDAEVAPAVAAAMRAAESDGVDAAVDGVASVALVGGVGCGGGSVGGGGGGGGGGGDVIIAPPTVELIRCDFLVDDSWKDADVVLVNSCCFSESLFAAIEARASHLLRPGTLVVTLRQQFAHAAGGHPVHAAAAGGTGKQSGQAAAAAAGDAGAVEEKSRTSHDVSAGVPSTSGGDGETMEEKIRAARSVGSRIGGEAGGGECWELLEATERRMSWGPSMMFVYRRTGVPPPKPK